MGGTVSYRRRHSRRNMYSHYPGSLPQPEDVFSGHYMASSYPVSPTTPVSPDHMDVDPYFQYAGFPGAMRRVNSDPHLFAYDPYMQYGMAQGGYDPYDAYDQHAYGAYGYPQQYDAPPVGQRWGSLPNLYDQGYDQGYVHLARNPRERPLLQKLFGPNSVAQRRNILKRLDHQQIDPFEKTAQWLMQSDQRRTR